MDFYKVIILIAIIFIFLIFAFIASYYALVSNRKMYKYFKCLPLIICFLVSTIIYPRLFTIYLGFLFSALGDALLLVRKKNLFLFGAASFFLSHVCISVTFFLLVIQKTGIVPLSMIIGIPVLLVILLLTFGLKFYKKLKHNAFLTPLYFSGLIVNLYLVINLLIYSFNPVLILILIGYIFFIFSDALIAIKKFIKPIINHDFFVISTYYIAQLLIFIGLILFI